MAELRDFVLTRDRICLAALYVPDHVCLDRWNRPHPPGRVPVLTLEHVPAVHSHTEGRKNDERHCVALCWSANVSGPSSALRERLRDHLRRLYPTCHAET